MKDRENDPRRQKATDGAGGRLANTEVQSPWRLRQARLAYAKDRRHGPWDESSGTRQLRLPLKRAGHPSLQKPQKETPGVRTYQKAWPPIGPWQRRLRARRVRRGVEATGVMNVGGVNGGARLAVAEGVVLREACVGETTHERHDNNGGGVREQPSQRGRSETEPGCGTTAYSGIYSDEGGRSTKAPTRTRMRRTGREASCDEEGTEPSLSEW